MIQNPYTDISTLFDNLAALLVALKAYSRTHYVNTMTESRNCILALPIEIPLTLHIHRIAAYVIKCTFHFIMLIVLMTRILCMKTLPNNKYYN